MHAKFFQCFCTLCNFDSTHLREALEKEGRLYIFFTSQNFQDEKEGKYSA